ncbi:unnamed protein product [Ascophyllum nodosum]
MTTTRISLPRTDPQPVYVSTQQRIEWRSVSWVVEPLNWHHREILDIIQ